MMAGPPFRLRAGPIHLGENRPSREALVSSSTDTDTFTKRVPIRTALAHGSLAFLSALGVTSLIWGYLISSDDSAVQRCVREFATVGGLLSISIIWSGLHVLIFRTMSRTFLDLASTAEDILISSSLIFYPTVACYQLKKFNVTSTCDYLTISGLAFAYMVAFIRLTLLLKRVIAPVIQPQHADNRPNQPGPKSHPITHSTSVSLYTVSACLSTIAFSTMIWVYSLLVNIARAIHDENILQAIRGFAGSSVLTILLLVVFLWVLANGYRIIMSGRVFLSRTSSLLELSLGAGLVGVSIQGFKWSAQLDVACPTAANCPRIWMLIISHHFVATLIAFLVGLVHIALFLVRLYPHLQILQDSILLYRLNSSSGLSFLQSRSWTDDEIISFLKMNGLTEEARDNIVSILYRVHDEDMALDDDEKSLWIDGPTSQEGLQDMVGANRRREAQICLLYDTSQAAVDEGEMV